MCGAQTGDPALYVAGLDGAKCPLLPGRVDVAAQVLGHRLGRGRPVRLDGPPFLRVLLEGLLRRPWVDVLPGDHAGRDLVDPPLGVDLAVEVARVLLAVEIAVASTPFAVGALLDVGQVASPSCRLSVVATVLDVAAEGVSVALVAHEAEALLVDRPRAVGMGLDVVGDGDHGVMEAVARVAGLVERLDGLLDEPSTVDIEPSRAVTSALREEARRRGRRRGPRRG